MPDLMPNLSASDAAGRTSNSSICAASRSMAAPAARTSGPPARSAADSQAATRPLRSAGTARSAAWYFGSNAARRAAGEAPCTLSAWAPDVAPTTTPSTRRTHSVLSASDPGMGFPLLRPVAGGTAAVPPDVTNDHPTDAVRACPVRRRTPARSGRKHRSRGTPDARPAPPSWSQACHRPGCVARNRSGEAPSEPLGWPMSFLPKNGHGRRSGRRATTCAT
jgi:hypothetical protein